MRNQLNFMRERGSGILLHITSLPSDYGIGDFGPSAYKFIDFLKKSGQKFWQVLPLNPINPSHGNSPYSSVSAFACNPYFLSPVLLKKEGYLEKKELEVVDFPRDKVNYESAIKYKEDILNKACNKFKGESREYESFCSRNSSWLEDFSLFVVLKAKFGGKVWSDWSKEIRDRDARTLRELKEDFSKEIRREKIIQYLAYTQWSGLKKYSHKKGIKIIGDMPIYVNYDSADVWSNPAIFKLNRLKKADFVAGVPPDYFSKTGQLWGNPVYRWKTLKDSGYDWWIKRFSHNLKLFDMLRIDHFRGLVAFWQVPANESTAINGKWIKVPVRDFLNTLFRKFNPFPIIAEDLGTITPDVKRVMKDFNIPGMKVLMFAFGEDNENHPYLPHNYIKNCMVYTGTHDNNTVRGWFNNEAGENEKRRLFDYLGHEVGDKEICWEFVRLVMESVANIVIVPMQDILGLGKEARMNFPGTVEGNWEWRVKQESLNPRISHRLYRLAEKSKR
ncbi:MAG: 4-alpha-glucanotransferase [Candidatus Omnitrophica bacterium]|nr:4-alpha-glucanotransferase [Candidatus Omnitrophota bacterium]MBD3268702.1 4-alpha-glucanotransferase [Candidatus Omnitrophota bacterium]